MALCGHGLPPARVGPRGLLCLGHMSALAVRHKLPIVVVREQCSCPYGWAPGLLVALVCVRMAQCGHGCCVLAGYVPAVTALGPLLGPRCCGPAAITVVVKGWDAARMGPWLFLTAHIWASGCGAWLNKLVPVRCWHNVVCHIVVTVTVWASTGPVLGAARAIGCPSRSL